MKRLLTILSIVAALSACSEDVNDAKRILEDSLGYSSELEFKRMRTFDGGVVCGEYSAYLAGQGAKTGLLPFLTVRGVLYKPPKDVEWAFFCSKNPAEVLFDTSGVGLFDADNTELARITEHLSLLDTALESYYSDYLFYPTMDQGLEALVTPPENPRAEGAGQDGYLESLPVDPWGRPYLYEEEQWGRTKGYFTITTLGADGVAGGGGQNADISSTLLQYLRHIAFILGQQ